MRYAILCYHDEAEVESWPKAKDVAVIAKRAMVTDRLAAEGKLGPVVRLMPTTSATTVRPSRSGAGPEPFIVDGPFAETKEQLLGFYVVECESLEEAIQIARDMGKDETGAFEVRPLRIFAPGVGMPHATVATSAPGAARKKSAPTGSGMLYAILIYGSEDLVEGMSKAEWDALQERHYAIRHELEPQQKVGPAFRLMPTTSAVTVRNGLKQVVLDGPFAETKEQLLGLWTLECENLEEAIAIAKRLTFESAAFEIRPVRVFKPASPA